MAIERDTNKAKGQTQATSADVQEQVTVQETHAQPNQTAYQNNSLANLGGFFSNPMSQMAAGESITKYHQTMKSILDEIPSPHRELYDVTMIEGGAAHLALSSLVLTLRIENTVCAFVLIAESSGPKIPDRTFTIGGNRNVMIDGVAGDVYDDNYWDTVHAVLQRTLGNVQIHEVGGMVIPRDCTPEDVTKLRQIAYHATTALNVTTQTYVTRQAQPFSASVLNTGEAISARLDFNAGDIQNASGHVVRSDVQVSMQGILSSGNSVSAKSTVPLTRMAGYVDLIYTPHPSQMSMNNPFAVMGVQEQYSALTYTPRLVITQLASGQDVDTLELQLLALTSATLLSKDNAWLNLMKPNYARGGVDLRDVGAIGYQVNFSGKQGAKPAKIDTKADKFSDQDLYAMLGAAINPSLVYSMDIDEAGEKTWLQSEFLKAAEGSTEAANRILDAANNLTNGAFAKIYQSGGSPVINEVNRIHLGQYTDETGAARDIRDFDQLAALNLLGAHDVSLVQQFSATYDDLNEPEVARLEKRGQMTRQTLSDGLRVTGYARRITFNPEFISKLVEAIAMAQLRFTPENFLHQQGPAYQGNVNAAQWGVGATNVGGAWGFANQGGYQGAAINMGPRVGGAWYQ